MNKLPGTIESNVLVGLDGQLFLYGGGQKSFAFSTGDLTPSPQDISNFSNNLDQRHFLLSERGIPYYHLIFPSKEVVLKEKVPPPWHDRIQSLFLSRYVSAQLSLADKVLYPSESLKELHQAQPVFRMLDSHMTDFGTLALTQQVLDKWGFQYDVSEFFDRVLEKQRGDLADMLKLKDLVPEEFLKPKFPLQTFDNRISLPGNTNNVCIVHHHKSLTKKRLLIFGDSFIKYALPFFAPVFRDVVYVRSATMQLDLVDLMCPDYVIGSNAERYLCKVSSDSYSKPMAHIHYGKTNYAPPANFIKAYTAQFSYRYHRNVYETWFQKVQANPLNWGDLGDCKSNQHIEILDSGGSFRATGPDPSFYFPNVGIQEGKTHSLEFELEADVKSIAKVYYQIHGDERFSESRTIKIPVRVGNNLLRFVLPSDSQIKSVLRIDPLACEGKFKIRNIDLKIISSEELTSFKIFIQENGAKSDLRPNLIIAGAQKAGSTTLATRLAAHPEIYLPPEKELNFFIKPNCFRDMESYLARFSLGADAAYRLDATPGYLWTERSSKDFVPVGQKFQPIPETIRTLLGSDTKILIILRHPTFRAISAFFHQFRMGRIGTNDRIRHLEKKFGLVDIGFYSEHIDNYFKVFPAENIRIYFLEEYTKNKEFYDAEMFRWLGLDIIHETATAKEDDNKNFKLEFSGGVLSLHNAIEQVKYLKKNDRRYSKMPEILPPVVEEEDIRFLNQVYVDELRKMRKRFPITIQIWPESPGLSEYIN